MYHYFTIYSIFLLCLFFVNKRINSLESFILSLEYCFCWPRKYCAKRFFVKFIWVLLVVVTSFFIWYPDPDLPQPFSSFRHDLKLLQLKTIHIRMIICTNIFFFILLFIFKYARNATTYSWWGLTVFIIWFFALHMHQITSMPNPFGFQLHNQFSKQTTKCLRLT